MSGGTIKGGYHQVGNDGTASNNFTWYQPAVADGTVRLGVGVAGATTLDAMTVNNIGNVGIGTSSPTSAVPLTLLANSSNAIGLNIRGRSDGIGVARFADNSDTENGRIDFRTDSAYINQVRNAPLIFNTNNTERMRIDSSGNLVIGTTRNDYGTLSVVNNSSTFATNQAYAYFKGSQAGDVSMPGLYIVKYDNNTTTSQILVKFGSNNGAAGQGQINANGGSAAAFGTFSDSRLKENIEPLPPQLDNILALKPSEFDYKDGSGHQIGFIAQEMQEVYPDVVAAGEDEMLMITGWDKTSARLVKAIQEQQELIKQLQADVDALKGAN